MPAITLDTFRNSLLQWKGASIVTIHAETAPTMRVTGNPYTGAVKRSAVNGVINWIYENAVNRQRERENLVPNFTAFPRKWGHRIHGTPLVEHKGKFYLEMKVQHATCRYFIGNVEVNHADISPWLRPHSPHRQGVSREIILRDYALENISAFIFGDTYQIG